MQRKHKSSLKHENSKHESGAIVLRVGGSFFLFVSLTMVATNLVIRRLNLNVSPAHAPFIPQEFCKLAAVFLSTGRLMTKEQSKEGYHHDADRPVQLSTAYDCVFELRNAQLPITADNQKVTRAHRGWALDSVSQRNTVTAMTLEDVKESPEEGVYVHGLYIEGASWDWKNAKLQESHPKILCELLPVIHVFAINTTAGKNPDFYECPVYKKPRRTDFTYVSSVDLYTDKKPSHWVLRGVALLSDIK